jgi:hypothetical protein
MSADNAGIYFFGPPPSATEIAAAAEGARTIESVDGDKTRVSITWPDVTMVVTIDPRWNRAGQLRGIRGWLASFPERERQSVIVRDFLANLDMVTACYGSVISPSYDDEGKVARLLKTMVRSSGGFIFTRQSFYSATGVRIAGLEGDPADLEGTRGA